MQMFENFKQWLTYKKNITYGSSILTISLLRKPDSNSNVQAPISTSKRGITIWSIKFHNFCFIQKILDLVQTKISKEHRYTLGTRNETTKQLQVQNSPFNFDNAYQHSKKQNLDMYLQLLPSQAHQNQSWPTGGMETLFGPLVPAVFLMVFVAKMFCMLCTISMFACWFQPGLISHDIVFSSHNKPVSVGLISPETNLRTG